MFITVDYTTKSGENIILTVYMAEDSLADTINNILKENGIVEFNYIGY